MKVEEKQLLNEISEDFIQFLMQGNLLSFFKKIDPDLNIRDINKLLRIHFVLTKMNEESKEVGVIDFISGLRRNIRRIKTIAESKDDIFLGEIKGKINWNKTIKQKIDKFPEGNMYYVCEKKERHYEIIENLILKTLLKLIYEIVTNDLQVSLEKKYAWLIDWVSRPELKEDLKHVYLKNVYLDKIELKDIAITNRMLKKALNSRLSIYRDSAKLLLKYNNIMNFNIRKNEVKELLRNTFIRPERVEVLFELYWIIMIIRLFKVTDLEFMIIEPGSNLIAKWKKNNYIFKIYHDSKGNLRFSEDLEDLFDLYNKENNYIGRKLKTIKKFNELLSKDSSKVWRGRPDIIIEKYKLNSSGEEDLKAVLIGEVKYTLYKEYAKKGLFELLEYIAFVKTDQDNYIVGLDDLFKKTLIFEDKITILGILFTDNIRSFEFEESEGIKLIKFGQIEKLERIINRFSI